MFLSLTMFIFPMLGSYCRTVKGFMMPHTAIGKHQTAVFQGNYSPEEEEFSGNALQTAGQCEIAELCIG